MAKIVSPATFADHYGVDPKLMASLGVLNPTLALDTALFIDPLLLPKSSHPEISGDACEAFEAHFGKIIKLLEASKKEGDVAWRGAEALFQFHEIRANCLGYGASSIGGSAFGPKLILQVMRTGKEIVDLGVKDPDLFTLLALFEPGIGPDRISDMTTHVIADALVSFNQRLLEQLKVESTSFTLLGKEVELALNPFEKKKTPVLLVPTDLLKELPLATDWDGVVDAAHHNASLRARVNQYVSHLWVKKKDRDAEKLRQETLADAEALKVLLDVVHAADNQPYDLLVDPKGLRRWAEAASAATKSHPLHLVIPQVKDLDAVYGIVQQIVQQFRQLVEKNGLWKLLWNGDKALPEKHSQLLFFGIAHRYCEDNNLDISPEADSGNGPVDFKISQGFDSKVLVEVKLSKNTKLLPGYTKQLEAYKQAEQTTRAIYLVIDVGKMGKKDAGLYALRNQATASGEPVSDIEIVDATKKKSASKL
jgi:hypothetical protein